MMMTALLLFYLTPAVNAAFVVLSPDDYRDNFVEGWPGPHADGSGVGIVNQSSYEWAVENLPLFESSDEDLYVYVVRLCLPLCAFIFTRCKECKRVLITPLMYFRFIEVQMFMHTR